MPNAGLSCGLETVRLIQEPVASALAYGLDLTKDQTVCVFDLGGGTLDICILELGNGVTEVLATGMDTHLSEAVKDDGSRLGGDGRLGGDDIDRLIMNWLFKHHLNNVHGLERTPRFLSNLKRLAEATKIKLSSAASVRIKFVPVTSVDCR